MLTFYQWLKQWAFKPPYMEGVYLTPESIKYGDQWSSKEWIGSQISRLEDVRAKGSSYLPQIPEGYDITCLMLNCLSNKNSITVLDFAGGTGLTFFLLKHQGGLLYPEKISWHVVDSKTLCDLGEEFKAPDDKISFSQSLPEGSTYDAIYINASLPYIDNHEDLFERLLAYNPATIVITRTLGGENNPDFFTQNYAITHISYHIYNIPKLINYFLTRGYDLVYKAKNMYEPPLASARFKNIPKEYQNYNTTNLVFLKKA